MVLTLRKLLFRQILSSLMFAFLLTNYFMLLQVILPLGVHREVDTHLRAHLSQKATNSIGSFDDSLYKYGRNNPASEGIYGRQEPMTPTSIAKEKILQRRSLQLRNQQQDWQVYHFSQFLYFICPCTLRCFSVFLHFIVESMVSTFYVLDIVEKKCASGMLLLALFRLTD